MRFLVLQIFKRKANSLIPHICLEMHLYMKQICQMEKKLIKIYLNDKQHGSYLLLFS